MGKKIVFCADGTWNRPGDEPTDDSAPTNVWKLFSALAGDAVRESGSRYVKKKDGQVALYVDGIGTTRSRLVNWFQGAVGAGVSSKIADGYLFVSRNYVPGDDVCIFGFSRGAYIARSLAGLVSQCGLLKLTGQDWRDEANAEIAVRRFFERKTAFGQHQSQTTASSFDHFATRFERWGVSPLARLMRWGGRYFSFSDSIERPCSIAMVGVWDTVGSLGVPVGLLDKASEKLFEFRDLTLSANVQCGYHAVAIDEFREAFQPTLWESRESIEQVWFCGAHADVGGGYPSVGLSDCALRWMMRRAQRHGLQFTTPTFAANPLQDPTDSYKKIFGERLARTMPERASLHESVVERLRQIPGYRPATLAKLTDLDTIAANFVIATD